MAYIWQRWMPDAYRKAGLKVVEVSGWENRGRPASTGNFDPRGPKTNHHTGTTTSATKKMPTLRTLIEGRPDLPGPLSQKGIGFDGTVYVIAAGRANHAGKVGKSGVTGMPYGADGNALALGDEVDTNGTQTMPKAQRDALAIVNAVDLKHFKRGTAYLHRHQDISGTGKWDLGSRTTSQLRGDAAAHLERLSAPKPVEMVTSDVRFVLANVRSNPLMSPAQAKADYVIAFAGARARKAQSVYINEYHPTYATVLAAAAKAYGYKVRAINAASGLAIATKATGWTLDGIAFSLLAGGIKGISPNRGVLRVGEKTPAGTRIVWDDIMLPRGWNNPQYSGYAKTSAMARTIFEKLKPIIVSQTGTLKSVAVLAGDVNQGSAVDWERHLGLKPAATVVRTGGTAVDKMMQAAVFVPAGATAKMVDKIDLGEGEENTDHGILFCHVQVTRPR
ncbi:MAG TPA: N-acetylmuramoyl-L-alanine amidase [Mycobacterium sp.]